MIPRTPSLLDSVLLIAGFALALIVLAGCAGINGERERSRDEMRQILEDAVRQPPEPEQTEALLIPEPPPTPPPLPEERFDIQIDDAPIRDVLMGLVAESEWNLVVHPAIDGRVTLNLRQVSVPEVLEVLQELYDIDVERARAGFIVRPAGLRTRVYEIDYLSMTRSGFSKTTVSSGQSTDLPPALLGGGGQSFSGGGGVADGNQDDNQSTQIRTESESSFWDDIQVALGGIIGEGEGRRVITNAQAGVVSITAMPAEQRAVADFLDAVQASVSRQVILEARIIEVQLRDEFRSGINWQSLARIDDFDFATSVLGGQNLFSDGVAPTAGQPVDVLPGSGLPDLASTAFGGPFRLVAGSTDFNAFIELLELQGETRVLSSPRIATTNNQKAVIKVGSDEFFVTGVQSQTAAGAASSATANSVQLTPFFSGIALDVTPQISASGEIMLHIHPSVSSVTEKIKSFTTGGQEERLPLALSTVRESDSVIRARSGQLVVIGGLMRDELSDQRIGTPGISRVPLFGNLFGSREDLSRKTELVILVKPIIVDLDSTWEQRSNLHLDRLRQLDVRGGDPQN